MLCLNRVGGKISGFTLPATGIGANGVHLTESVHKVVLQKSIFAQIRELILYISNKLTTFEQAVTFARHLLRTGQLHCQLEHFTYVVKSISRSVAVVPEHKC